ncbi:MAG: phosphoribosylanthranilate isomerase [Candidatus Methanomethylophilaceae archaeon]|jgi:phosphoribosylanthranilate isomerase|nr:phosphoribosylanthranilate isomerase [Candidatus Methanomethylophilaceae archaeon]NLF34144.1 phosphoribosylanthranilate isomerase [Thermoplasmatales archaeon]
MTLVKICGLSRREDVSYANEALPDFVGFVFAESRRRVFPSQAADLRSRLDRGIAAVGVFADAPAEQIACLVQNGTIDIIQLHGGETEDYIRELRSVAAAPIIKAVTMEPGIGIPDTDADLVLLDSGRGGSGRRFDWDAARCVRRSFFLAGGLEPDNVREAIDTVRPYAVDVSSGVETNGMKDKKKMMDMVRRIRDE